ncbi:MAG: hypothetical protein IJG68_02360 [Bacilli bacterium]|nr:hypothetical protein [Bacilli bacterium]
MRKSNLFKNLLILSNIIVPIFTILVLVFNTKLTYSLYWISIPALIFFMVAFIREVDKGLVDSDLDESKKIKRAYNDSTTISTVFYAVIYLGIEFVDMINSNLRNNVYLICGFYAITLFYELIIYLSIRNALKETSKLLNEKK